MFDHFMDGSGTNFSNTDLTNAVKNHQNTQNYVNGVIAIVKDQIVAANGDINDLYYDEDLWVQPVERKEQVIVKQMIAEIDANNTDLYLPYYGIGNGVRGLTLALNGWYGNKVEIEHFQSNGDSFSGTIRFTFYDHFGVDTADLSEEKFLGVEPGTIAGFRQWYILQHWDELGAPIQPKPFVTIVSYTVAFSGTY
jgi:hypothetical protein